MTAEYDITDLTNNEKTLIHLHRIKVSSERKVFPIEITQEGIAKAVGMRKTHVPRTVKKLEEDGLLTSKKGYVKEKSRKLKVYFPTEEGKNKANSIERDLYGKSVSIIRPEGVEEKTIEDVIREESRYGIELLDIVIAREESESIDLAGLRFAKASEKGEAHLFNVPEKKRIVNREAEISAMEKWLENDAPFFVVSGQRGSGKTTVVTKFVREKVAGTGVLWFSMSRDRQLESFFRTASDYFSDISDREESIQDHEELLKLLRRHPTLIIVDDYFEVEEDFVDFMTDLLRSARKGSGVKVMITMPLGTPSYSRFFTISDIEKDRVRQSILKGLDNEDARTLLGKNVEDGAMRNIFLLTKNNPAWLVMIRDEDQQGLLEKTRFTVEEIRLLFFWKEQVKEDAVESVAKY